MRPPRRTRALVAIGVGAALVASLSACAPFALPPPVRTLSSPAAEAIDPQYADFYLQELDWQDCGNGLQCTSAKAPLDWADPAGARIDLAIARLPASTRDVKGSILVDPGGPGVSAIDYLRSAGGRVLGSGVESGYDLVAVDPRGVGASTPIDCLPDSQLDGYLYGSLPGTRGSPEWVAAATAQSDAFAASCAAASGPLLGHIDSASVARDYDMVRALLGDHKLNYLGYSYGTLIGALYAQQFPDHVGRMVLDGAIDPGADAFDLTLGQAQGFESALTAYLKGCLGHSGCPFNGTVDVARSQVSALLANVDKAPLKHADGRKLNGPTLLTAIIDALYSPSSWANLSSMLAEVKAGGSDKAFALADSYNDRSSTGGYASNRMEAFIAVGCLDYPTESDPAVIEQQNAQLVAAAPTVGPWWTYGNLACEHWPVPPTRQPAPVSDPDAPAIVVVGTTGDPATPYAWAQSLASQLQSSRLITYQGTSHTAYNSSGCVRQQVDRYFTDGTLPPVGARC